MVFWSGIARTIGAPSFSSGVVVGTVNSAYINEASGLVASRQNPGVLWTHNDSRFRGSVFAVSTNGELLAQFIIPDVYTGDFEDITLGPGPLPEFHYVYLGDIGDNFGLRENIRVFRFPEPAAYHFQSNAPPNVLLGNVEEIVLSYPDQAENAEAMFVDPWSGDLFIATKNTNSCQLFRATREQLNSGAPVVLTKVADPSFRSVSAADISSDGTMILMRRPGRAGLWRRGANQSVAEAFAAEPVTVPVIGQPAEPNGESIAFHPDGLGYYTLSEGLSQPLYYFERTDPLGPVPRRLVPPGAAWDVNDFGDPLPPDWMTNFFDVSLTGLAPLGYGGSERSTVWFGDSLSKVITTAFAHTFTNTAPASNLAVRVSCDSGLAVYLNGIEILRRHLLAGAASDEFGVAPNQDEGRAWFSIPVNPQWLQVGRNILAAEVHRFDSDGPHLHFDAQLVEASAPARPWLVGMSLSEGAPVGRIAGPSGLNVYLEQSADLNVWSLGPSVLLTNGVGTFQPAFTNAATFFRLSVP